MTGAVRFVVLDLGGVVCRFDPAARLRALEELTGRGADEIEAAVWGSGLDAAAERGEIDPPAVRGLLAGALGGRVDAAALRSAWSLAFSPDDAVLRVVDRITVPTVLFSNNGPIVDDCLDHELARVRGRFSHVLLSWQLGAVKPDPAAFDAVADRVAATAPELLLVDDATTNVDAARRCGWRAEPFTGVPRLVEALATAGVLGTVT
ncbi:MAG TPA: HAD family phosphatase [Acidimicrobiia bacterium]|nr:HAD family phosphatase [Acidimicrobiia bacterium]